MIHRNPVSRIFSVYPAYSKEVEKVYLLKGGEAPMWKNLWNGARLVTPCELIVPNKIALVTW
jgi:hypothetical protein